MTNMKILLNEELEFEIDPNENGLPVLHITHRFADSKRILSNIWLSLKELDELVYKLTQYRKDMI